VRIIDMTKVEPNGSGVSAGLFFLTGLGTGVALTLLFAPRSGAAMRRLIGRKVEKGEDWMKEKTVAAQDCVREHVDELRDRVKEAAEAIGRS
jgi:gas vesicle protein